MREQIEQKIKELYGSKGDFCRKVGIRPSNLSERLNSFVNSVARLNKFLNPLKLRLRLEVIEDDEA